MRTPADPGPRGDHVEIGRPRALASVSHAPALALALAMLCVGRVGAAPLEQDAGLPFGFARAEHGSYASTDVRTDAAPQLYRGARAVTVGGGGGNFQIIPA